MTSHRKVTAAAVLCGFWLCGCSQQAPESAKSAGSAGTAAPAAQGPTDDPCALVSDGAVRKAFADAKPGVRDHHLDQYKILTCTWDTPTNTVAAQIFEAHGTVEDELRSRVSGSVDPLKPGAGAKIEYETIEGLGDESKMVAAKADPNEGILSDAALIGIRRDKRMVVFFSRSLIDGDRATTLKALESLGRAAAGRI